MKVTTECKEIPEREAVDNREKEEHSTGSK
jgi:hypothetical protein